jgi:hypothetical protein
MITADRVTPAQWLIAWSLDELRAARKALDHYARHNGGCPMGEGRGEPCGCGLDAAKTRLLEAVRTVENLPAALEKPDAPPPSGSPAESGSLPPHK